MQVAHTAGAARVCGDQQWRCAEWHDGLPLRLQCHRLLCPAQLLWHLLPGCQSPVIVKKKLGSSVLSLNLTALYRFLQQETSLKDDPKGMSCCPSTNLGSDLPAFSMLSKQAMFICLYSKSSAVAACQHL